MATGKALTLSLGCGAALAMFLLSAAPCFVHRMCVGVFKVINTKSMHINIHNLNTVLVGHTNIAQEALNYLSIRAWACPGALLMLAATGACRGHRDPATPLYGAFAQYATNFVLDIALIFGVGMGIEGAAAAATIGQYVGLAVVLRGLVKQGDLALQDVGRVPSAQDVGPYLTVRNPTYIVLVLR